jgi:predicted TIM-barrel fold metal-dependent hydrolase
MTQARFISADSHLMEPADFWQKRLDNKFKDQAPRVVKRPDGKGYLFVAPEINPFPVAGGFAAGRSGQELKEFMDKGYEAARPSGWDPAERLKDQDVDGVAAEVLYPTLAMVLYQLQDRELQNACFRAYNDWTAEFCSYNPRRLVGAGLVALLDIDEGIKELQRCAKKGLRSVMISGNPSIPYRDHAYDPFWQAAQEHNMLLALHVITGTTKESTSVATVLGGGKGNIAETYMGLIYEVQRSLSSIVLGGVLERFPRLQIVSAENDVGWFPHFMYRMDHAYEKFNAMLPEPLPMRPSEYIKRQVWATFLDDPIGPATYKLFGEGNYMWGSDFPHTDSTWPRSREVIETDFAGVPDEITRKMVFDNAVRLYDLRVE